jgi:hypothetical protein
LPATMWVEGIFKRTRIFFIFKEVDIRTYKCCLWVRSFNPSPNPQPVENLVFPETCLFWKLG